MFLGSCKGASSGRRFCAFDGNKAKAPNRKIRILTSDLFGHKNRNFCMEGKLSHIMQFFNDIFVKNELSY